MPLILNLYCTAHINTYTLSRTWAIESNCLKRPLTDKFNMRSFVVISVRVSDSRGLCGNIGGNLWNRLMRHMMGGAIGK